MSRQLFYVRLLGVHALLFWLGGQQSGVAGEGPCENGEQSGENMEGIKSEMFP